MAKKKYLNLEQAAEVLGIETTELNRLREGGEIRAFADRGSWKFRPEDVENLKRSRQPDSAPEVPLAETSDDSDFGATIMPQEGDSGAEMVLDETHSSFDEEGSSDDESTIIREQPDDLSGSNSDVKLVYDEALMGEDEGSSEEFSLSPAGDSDSDVRLTSTESAEQGSDSNVKLVGSSAEIQASSQSSDGGSDSDVKLIQAGDNQAEHYIKPPDDSGDEYSLATEEEGSEEDEGSSILGDDSGIALSGDSGISLASDSGISLADDSGISVADDSGISVAGDSGISLAGDSGISLAGPDDSGIALDVGARNVSEHTETISTVGGDAHRDDGILDTQLEMPAESAYEESEFEFSPNALDSESGTSVITLDDDDIVSGEATVLDESDALDLGEELLGEDDELEDVFGAGAEDFEESLTAGESQSGFAIAARIGAPLEQDWGMSTHVGLWAGCVAMGICGLMLFDVIRTMWGVSQPDPLVMSRPLIEFFSAMF